MEYSKLVEVYEYLEKTPGRLKKVEAIAKLLAEADESALPKLTMLVQGKLFPSWDEREVGVASQMMVKIVATATGFPEKEVMERFKKKGDLGLVAEELAGSKRQKLLLHKVLTVDKVFENLRSLAAVAGAGSQDRKMQMVSELIASAAPKEAKYVVRTTLQELRIGVAEGVVRDAIAKAFFPEKGREAVEAVEWAWFLRPDYGEVAVIAKAKGFSGLRAVKLKPGEPTYPLLAERIPSLEEALKAYENPVIETKFDGARIQIHKDGEKVWLFTRRLEDVTRQFPDLVKLAKSQIKAKTCVLEGELLGIDPKTGRPLPFQFLSQRVRRKYDIEKLAKEVPAQANLFDIVYLNGEMLFNEPFSARRKKLESAVTPLRGKFQLAEQLITRDLKKAEAFYNKSLEAGQEGVIVKNLDAKYQPGRRVAGGWLKVKPVMENLDLAIIGATWGTGKRAGWLGSFVLGCRDPDTGRFLECGMMGTGIKEKSEAPGDVTFKELTKMLEPYMESAKGNEVKIKPKLVVEVAYEEIQKSPNYASGFALRFPRLIRLREDKGPAEADTAKRIETLFSQQRGRKTSRQ